jgi:hypothetical protein
MRTEAALYSSLNTPEFCFAAEREVGPRRLCQNGTQAECDPEYVD